MTNPRFHKPYGDSNDPALIRALHEIELDALRQAIKELDSSVRKLLHSERDMVAHEAIGAEWAALLSEVERYLNGRIKVLRGPALPAWLMSGQVGPVRKSAEEEEIWRIMMQLRRITRWILETLKCPPRALKMVMDIDSSYMYLLHEAVGGAR